MNALIIVADAVHARIFRTRKGLKNLEEREDPIHVESRRRDRELDTDAAGRTGDQQSTLDPRTSAKETEERTFAKQLGKHIKELYNQDRFEELILVATPRFLGMLRDELPAPVDKLESRAIPKEVVNLSAAELAEYIRNYE